MDLEEFRRLTPEQQDAFDNLKAALERCDREKVLLTTDTDGGYLYAYNGKNMCPRPSESFYWEDVEIESFSDLELDFADKYFHPVFTESPDYFWCLPPEKGEFVYCIGEEVDVDDPNSYKSFDTIPEAIEHLKSLQKELNCINWDNSPEEVGRCLVYGYDSVACYAHFEDGSRRTITTHVFYKEGSKNGV